MKILILAMIMIAFAFVSFGCKPLVAKPSKVNPGPNSIAISSGNNQSVVAGNSLPANLVVVAKDSSNKILPGVAVLWTTSGGTLVSSLTTTNTNGLASNVLNPGTVAGVKNIRATISGTATSVDFSATVTAAGASALTSSIATLPTSLTIGSTSTVTMNIKDQYGNPVSGQNASFVSTGSANVITQLVATTDSNGRSTGTISSTTAETKTISFGVPVALSGLNSTLTFNPLPIDHFTVSGLLSAAAGTSGSVVVSARDSNSNLISGYVGTVHFTSSDSQAVLPPNYTFTTADNGSHTFSGIVLKTAGTQSISVNDTVTTSATGVQTAISISATSADNLTIIAGDAQTATVGTALSINPKVQVKDRYGNAVAGTALTFTPSAGSSVGLSSVTSDASGYASTTFTNSLIAGANTLVVTGATALPGLSGNANVTFNETGIGEIITGCDCGSTDTGAPCLGNSISHSRSSGTLPTSTIEIQFQCDGGACACGKFANEYDYWVAPRTPNGEVKIISMSPAATGAADSSLRNGWVANPSAIITSSFMDGRLGDMSQTGQPINPSTLSPYTIDTSVVPVTTIIKSHSMLETGTTSCGGTDVATGLSRHCFWQAGVLTVLSQTPDNAGSTVLRPPMTGTYKPLLSTTDINFAALPNLPYPVRNNGTIVTGKTWDYALDRLGPPKVELGPAGDWPYWQYLPPMYNFTINISGYPPRSMEGLLDSMQLLAIDGTGYEQEKRLLAIRSVQWGIDYYYMWKSRNFGSMFRPNGGHAVGRYLPTIIAAALMTGSAGDEMKTNMIRVNNGTGDKCGFDISGELFSWPDTNRILYGYFNIVGCGGYSDYTRQTNSNVVDPAHIGDNGRLAVNAYNDATAVNSCAGAYQAITAGPTQATANLVRAIPAARAIAYEHMIPYITRMFDNGIYCRPDHIPLETFVSAFGKCVGGININEQCSTNADCPSSTCAGNNNQYTSWLARNMWAKYKDCYDDNSCPGMSGP